MFADYLLELSLQDYLFNRSPASQVAAAVLHLTLQMMRSRRELIWSPNLAYHTQYKEAELVLLVLKLREIHWNVETSEFRSSKNKFESAEYLSVSLYAALRTNDLRFDTVQKPSSSRSEAELSPEKMFSSRKNGIASLFG